MTAATQHAAPEDIMALLDGELAAADARTVAEHMEICAECTEVAGQFRKTAQALSTWTIPSPSEKVESVVREKSSRLAAPSAAKAPARLQLAAPKWRPWAIAGAGVFAGVVLVMVMFQTRSSARFADYAVSESRAETGGIAMKAAPPPSAGPEARTQSQGYADDATPNMAALQSLGVVSGLVKPTAMTAAPPNPAAPMIARTVSLIIQVKDITRSRLALDAILSHYQGYAAELTINTPEGSARSFSASLRIPAPALPASLADLRNLGRVQNESQSGEEVTQQHADLVARLRNARETEQRLLAILQQRTGKVEEILQVEEQISNTRGDIERMEAEQKALEHRVDFATVQLQLAEEYQAQLTTPANSIGTRMRNAFVAGLGNAGSNILGIVLFFEEFGPVLLLWIVILGTPAWFLWRRYCNAQSRI